LHNPGGSRNATNKKEKEVALRTMGKTTRPSRRLRVKNEAERGEGGGVRFINRTVFASRRSKNWGEAIPEQRGPQNHFFYPYRKERKEIWLEKGGGKGSGGPGFHGKRVGEQRGVNFRMGDQEISSVIWVKETA